MCECCVVEVDDGVTGVGGPTVMCECDVVDVVSDAVTVIDVDMLSVTMSLFEVSGCCRMTGGVGAVR